MQLVTRHVLGTAGTRWHSWLRTKSLWGGLHGQDLCWMNLHNVINLPFLFLSAKWGKSTLVIGLFQGLMEINMVLGTIKLLKATHKIQNIVWMFSTLKINSLLVATTWALSDSQSQTLYVNVVRFPPLHIWRTRPIINTCLVDAALPWDLTFNSSCQIFALSGIWIARF